MANFGLFISTLFIRIYATLVWTFKDVAHGLGLSYMLSGQYHGNVGMRFAHHFDPKPVQRYDSL